jgi:hypothetical protein
MLIGYAIETLRAEAPLHATSTPGVEAVLAAGRRSRDSDCSEGLWRFYPEDAALRRTSSLHSERRLGKRPPMGHKR